jgi:hypothetical protein
MPREVEINDLELFAINTGELYEKHKKLGEDNGWAWVKHVRDTVLPLYCRQVETVWASSSTVDAVASALSDYYKCHNVETKALED